MPGPEPYVDSIPRKSVHTPPQARRRHGFLRALRLRSQAACNGRSFHSVAATSHDRTRKHNSGLRQPHANAYACRLHFSNPGRLVCEGFPEIFTPEWHLQALNS